MTTFQTPFCPCCGDPDSDKHRPARITFACWSCGETWTDDFCQLVPLECPCCNSLVTPSRWVYVNKS